jgi:hypothetical protein
VGSSLGCGRSDKRVTQAVTALSQEGRGGLGLRHRSYRKPINLCSFCGFFLC